MSRRSPRPRAAAALLVLAAALLAGCGAPLHTWEVHTTSTPRDPFLDVAALARERVATFGMAAPAALQGLGPALSHALTGALDQVSPFIWDMPTYEVVNRLNDRDLAAAYGDLLTGFARSGILDREPLRRIGLALDAPYVLQPGVAEFNQVLGDKFEVVGWKLLKTRLTTLRLWLQLWDTRTGRLLWEGSGEVTVAAQLLTQEASVSLEDIAQRLWLRMVDDDLLRGATRSRFLFSN